ncbi:hypothetical protein [Patiriisocius marinus]|uniref:Uncharacterized protein n=1 Tax=Patiriisocius marinus TaxID=1397112 RepID=A0A5J4IQQ8_9FLAO|nr:hypothetical protein [Patiriisocius marinus]GER60205.1 hypothetical protein ULMA_23130 [Patiriisocius marinus]
MTKKAAQTASFMVRFNQKIYEEKGESKVQWRGNVSHVQGGEDTNFTDFNDAVLFIQQHLEGLTKEATKHKSREQQEGILSKSFSLFKTFAATGPQLLKDTLKDPRKQVAFIQDQISEYGEELMEKVPLDEWRSASKSDFQEIKESLSSLTKSVAALSKKVDEMDVTKPAPKPTAQRKTAIKKPPAVVKKTTAKAKTTKTTKK